MSKKQNNKPTLSDAAGHFGGFFKTTGLLVVRGIGESARLVADTADKAFTPKQKGKHKAPVVGLSKKELKRIDKNLSTLQAQNLELAKAVTELRKQPKKKDAEAEAMKQFFSMMFEAGVQHDAPAKPARAKPADAKPAQPAKAKTTKTKPVKIAATM